MLKMALDLAQERKGFTAPNPAVGAVLVKEGEILGWGSHWASGHPHAEVEALRMAKEKEKIVSGATLYVSLEPCCHFGKTPPCTDAIIQNQIKKVVFGFEDPNRLVKGKGVERLKESGIEVERVQWEEVDEFYRTYRYWSQNKKSWFTGKLALTAEGYTSGLGKERLLISGQEAHRYTHQRRRFSDAILTSWKTVKNDDPLLTSRESQETSRPVFILDKNLEFQDHLKLAQRPQNLTLLHLPEAESSKREALQSKGFRCLSVKGEQGQIELTGLSSLFGEMGFHEVWIEVGATLFEAFMNKKLFQEAIFYQSKASLLGRGHFDLRKIPSDAYECEREVDWGGDLKQSYLLKGLE